MAKKLILTLMAAALVVLVIGLISAYAGGKETGEESSEAAQALQDELLIVPSSMPDGITFEIPAGFTETASQFYDKYYVKNDASVIVTGQMLPDYNQTLDSFVAGAKSQYQQTAEHFMLLSEETVQLDGTPCRVLEFTYDIVGSESAQQMECTTAFAINAGTVYIITCKSHKDTYNGYRNVFRKMLESVRLTDPNAPAAAPDGSAGTEAPAAETDALPAA